MNPKKILIATGIYPPKIGGPAQYAKNLRESFEKMGHVVNVKTYGMEDRLPSGIRHLFFFFKIIPSVMSSDIVFILDTFSVGLPSVLACRIFGKKAIIKTGGDFLWEQYVEKNKKKVLLKDFYRTESQNLSFKEKAVFKLTRWALRNSSKIIFSTAWQRDIFMKAYLMNAERACVVENFYGPKESDDEPDSKLFLASARKLFLKNFDSVARVFGSQEVKGKGASVFTASIPFESFMEKMRASYAVIVASVSEVSPNMILDAIRLNRPFVCTKEVGIFDRIKDAGLFVDPLDEKEIEEAVLRLLTEEGYKEAKEKVRNFNFVHTWDEIAREFLISAGI